MVWKEEARILTIVNANADAIAQLERPVQDLQQAELGQAALEALEGALETSQGVALTGLHAGGQASAALLHTAEGVPAVATSMYALTREQLKQLTILTSMLKYHATGCVLNVARIFVQNFLF